MRSPWETIMKLQQIDDYMEYTSYFIFLVPIGSKQEQNIHVAMCSHIINFLRNFYIIACKEVLIN